ncbi:MAG: glycosyltransferase, partial [Ornithinimicrobium sp.]
MLDALLPAAAELRWISLSRAGHDVSSSRVLAHPLLTDGEVSVLEQPARADEIVGGAADPEPGDWGDDVRWLWFLPADARPAPDVLVRLISVLRESSRVALVGPKLVRAEAPRVVVGVGHRITRWGRSAERDDVGAYDQGQLDDRSDVIGVPLEGMLVRRTVLEDLGGLADGFHPSVAGLDLSWRAHLHGYRVQVVPEAVVGVRGAPPSSDGDVATGAGGRTDLRERAQARAELALARVSWWRLVPRALAMLACGLGFSMVMLTLRRPRAAGVAWAEGAAVLAASRVWRSRWRFRGGGAVTERDLAGVFAPGRAARSVARLTPLDDPSDRSFDLPPPRPGDESPDRGGGRAGLERGHHDSVDPRTRSTAERSGTSIESGPIAEELAVPEVAPTSLRWRPPGWVGVLVVAAFVTAVRWRDLAVALRPDGWGVLAPEILGVSAGSSQLWSSWWLGWTGAGLGQPGPGPSWLLPLAGFSWMAERLPGGPEQAHAASVVTSWLLCASVLLSVVVAYLSARVVVRSAVVRAVLALGWAGVAPLVVAVDSGRLGPVVVHVVAPAVVAGVVLSLGEGRRGTSAAFGTALLIAGTAWWVPAVAGAGLATGAVVTVLLKGASRLRGLVLMIVPVALLGPHLAQYLADPVLWFGGAGATVAGAEALPAWQGLLMHPGGPVRISIWWVLPAWLLALIAVLAPGGRRAGRLATGLTVGGLCGITVGLVASRVVIGQLPAGYAEAGLG